MTKEELDKKIEEKRKHSDVLSQPEIDELLKAIEAGENDFTPIKRTQKIKIYDFKRPDVFSKCELRDISSISEGIARNIRRFLNSDYDINAKVPNWNKTNRFLAFTLYGNAGKDAAKDSAKDNKKSAGASDNDFYIASNMDIYDLTISLPSLPEGKKWYLVEDTSIENDESRAENPMELKYEKLYEQRRYVLLANSTIILMSK